MRRLVFGFVVSCSLASGISQTTSPSDEALLAKTRALYDAPFTRELVSFDCAVEFDWKQHFIGLLGSLPPAAAPTAERLQTIQHRVVVSRSGAVVSSDPKAPDLTGIPNGARLEQVFNIMVAVGLNAWLPFGTDVILPVAPTRFSFEKIEPGYKLGMNGPGVEATVLLDPELRMTSAVSQLPQPMRFTTDFTSGPNGLVLASIKSGTAADAAPAAEATFSFTYQTVQGFQLPSRITVAPTPAEVWHYGLTDCKVTRGVTVKVGPPPSTP